MGKTGNKSDTLNKLYDLVVSRKDANPKKSYVAKMFEKGREKIAEKMGEEAVETIVATVAKNKKETILESADLVFHLMILWAERGIKPNQVMRELEKRMGISGLDEKARRKMKG